MRHAFVLAAVGLVALAVGCGIFDSSDEGQLLPLESSVAFTIGPHQLDSSRAHLMAHTNSGYPNTCYHLVGFLKFVSKGGAISLFISGVALPSGEFACGDMLAPGHNAWRLPWLEPGTYPLSLVLHYPHGHTVVDRYTVEYISPDSVIISPLRGDSSFVSPEIFW